MLRDGHRLVSIGSAIALLVRATARAAHLQNQSMPPPGGTGAIAGVVTDGATGRPLTGVIVSLPGGGAPRRRTISDSKGRFVFAGLAAAERYSLEGEKPGYVAAALARRGPLFSSGTRVALANGEWIADANFPMLRLGAINGAAVDERGEPVLNVPVRILTRVPLAGGMRLASGPSARTDDRGVYWIAGLMAGSCFVAVLSVQSVVPPSTAPGVAAGLSPLEVTLGVARFRRWLASTSRESGW